MSKDKYYQLVVSSNEDVASVLFIYLHVDIIVDSDKQYIVTNIEFEAIIPSIKNNLFHQCMVNFLHKLDLSDQKYQTNGVLRDENDKEKLFFPIKYFVSYGTYRQLMYFMSNIFLKDKIDGFCVQQFQLAYISKKTHPSH